MELRWREAEASYCCAHRLEDRRQERNAEYARLSCAHPSYTQQHLSPADRMHLNIDRRQVIPEGLYTDLYKAENTVETD